MSGIFSRFCGKLVKLLSNCFNVELVVIVVENCWQYYIYRIGNLGAIVGLFLFIYVFPCGFAL